MLLAASLSAGCTCGDQRSAPRDPDPVSAETVTRRDAAHAGGSAARADASTAAADASAARADASAPPPEVTLVLAATCEDGADVPSGLAVSLSVPLTGRPVFRIDDEVMGSAGTAGLISDATAEDRRGVLPLIRRVRNRILELAPGRDVVGTITLRYHVRSIATGDEGPREGLRHDATGIGGHGRHFLVLPESRRRFRMRVDWAAAQCTASTQGTGATSAGSATPSRATGSSSFGDGAVADLVGELVELREGAYFYGRPQRIAVDDGSLHLRTAWFGEPAFDVGAAAAWAARVLVAHRAFFADDDPGLYAMFVRVIAAQDDRANGIGHPRAFLSAIGPRTPFGRRLKVNIAHEMLHRWLGLRLRLRGPEGTNYWFSEGFTVHYANVIAFRAGLFSVDEFLDVLNDIATRHFDNKHAAASNDEIRRGFYRDPALSIVPYTRGALYAAELDAALRTASHGKRTLDVLLRELYQAARAPAGRDGLPADAVRKLVVRELGRAGAERYDAVIVRGGQPQPSVDAYGPCFARTPRKPGGFTWVRVPGVADAQCRAW